MNVFELSAVASPLAGAIAGGVSVTRPGAIPTATGIGLGLVIGLVLSFVALVFTGLTSRVLFRSVKAESLNLLQWLVSFAGVLVPMAAPFAAWALSAFVIARLLHL
jgi:hypothetical protein